MVSQCSILLDTCPTDIPSQSQQNVKISTIIVINTKLIVSWRDIEKEYDLLLLQRTASGPMGFLGPKIIFFMESGEDFYFK